MAWISAYWAQRPIQEEQLPVNFDDLLVRSGFGSKADVRQDAAEPAAAGANALDKGAYRDELDRELAGKHLALCLAVGS